LAWELPDHAPVVMLPGRLTGWKGQAVLISALALLARTDAVGVLVGSDQGRAGCSAGLRQQAEALGLGARLRLVGECADMPPALRLADVVVHASTAPEAFGRVVIKAQAMGRPVIAADLGGPVETVETGADEMACAARRSGGAGGGDRCGAGTAGGDAGGDGSGGAGAVHDGGDAGGDVGGLSGGAGGVTPAPLGNGARWRTPITRLASNAAAATGFHALLLGLRRRTSPSPITPTPRSVIGAGAGTGVQIALVPWSKVGVPQPPSDQVPFAPVAKHA
jgi:hypothetical protein